MSSKPSHYPDIDPKADFPAIEKGILARWAKEETFAQSISQRSSGNEFVFYDGPPFANGLPHHGHLLTGYVKDVVPRYQTMRGKRVERRFGWDCHGLPAEMEAEKQLDVAGRAAISEFGIAEFNAHCRASVMRYTAEWQETVSRQARWVDFDNDYKTMDCDFMESVMWAFSELYQKGLIYEAYRVMPYSWGAETPLSNFEIRLDDATRPRQDPAITVAFDLAPLPGDPGPLKVLAWTTTPWTLPSNLALAVGPDISYDIVDHDGTLYVIGSETRENYQAQLGDSAPVATITGADLIGRSYEPLFPYFAERQDPNHDSPAFRVLAADFIETAEGTGIVHMAPGFGEDDQRICEQNGLQIGRVVPVNDEGRFSDDVPEWAGENVFEANPGIIRHLKEQGRIIRHDTYDHNYPHCWRTGTPIIYKAISSWYVEVTKIRDRLQELNQEINWVPGHVQDGRFGMWLAGARDWSISRNRFWGSPIPVWKSDNPDYPRIDVYGSLDALEADFGVRPDDLHRPYIDELTRPNPDDPTGQSTMRRVEEVLDCWFESGSMPFAQLHYPFENSDWFESHFPADFIVEYINQTRGWFYTLHVLAGALFDRPAFQNVICHGILLAEDGTKLSKSLRNYTEPSEIFNKQGADALRWYFISSNIVRGGDARISSQAIDDVTRQVMLPIWNAYSFFTLYANVEGYEASFRTDSTNLLDRYVLAKTQELIAATTEAMEAYDLSGATDAISSFLDALNNWYIRRSRERFWNTASDAEFDADAHDTLFSVLVTLSKVIAPFLPLLAEEIWSGLCSTEESVHLQAWPAPDSGDADSAIPSDPTLVESMDLLRDAASAALALREDRGLRVRLPLASATLAGARASLIEPFADLLADEINVKSVYFSSEIESYGTFRLQPNARTLGPKLGPDVQHVIKAAKAGDWTDLGDGTVRVGEFVLAPDDFSLALDPTEGSAVGSLGDNDTIIVLDTVLTPELESEGLAGDWKRAIQATRRDLGLQVTDRITITFGPGMIEPISEHLEWIKSETLATAHSTDDALTAAESAYSVGGQPAIFRVSPAV